MLRDPVVLNPHYKAMGLYGSEYWTYVLPRRAGEAAARSLTERCLPIGAAEAARIGLANEVLPGDPAAFETAVARYAARLAAADDHPNLLVRRARTGNHCQRNEGTDAQGGLVRTTMYPRAEP